MFYSDLLIVEYIYIYIKEKDKKKTYIEWALCAACFELCYNGVISNVRNDEDDVMTLYYDIIVVVIVVNPSVRLAANGAVISLGRGTDPVDNILIILYYYCVM